VVEQAYPHQWTERAPGDFVYSISLKSTNAVTVSLVVDGSLLGNSSQITNIGHAPTVFAGVNLPSLLMAGQPLSLQLNSSATDFASLAGNNTGWRVQLLKPDNSTTDLGLMADGAVWYNVVYKWSMTVPGDSLNQVGIKQFKGGQADTTTRYHIQPSCVPICICGPVCLDPKHKRACIQAYVYAQMVGSL
jgi:hypothetical protein